MGLGGAGKVKLYGEVSDGQLWSLERVGPERYTIRSTAASRRFGNATLSEIGADGVGFAGGREKHWLISGIRNTECSPEKLGDPSVQKKIVVYVYSIAGYDPARPGNVPCVPQNIDAFIFVTGQADPLNFKAWTEVGWQLIPFKQIPGNQYISSSRITVKSLKWTPPSWIVDGRYDYVVTFDFNFHINLLQLASFLKRYKDYPAIMFDWRHFKNCDRAFECFLNEIEGMLYRRKGFIVGSRQNCIDWRQRMLDLDRSRTGFRMLHYFDCSILFRNMAHQLAPKVTAAFEGVYNESFRIERDQFLAPYFLWKEGVDADIKVVTKQELEDSIDRCKASEHSSHVGRARR